jgi:uncharacterized membrane protein
VSFDDWVLALHVLSAFAWVAGIVLFWVLIAAVRGTDTAEGTLRMEPVVRVGNASVPIGRHDRLRTVACLLGRGL